MNEFHTLLPASAQLQFHVDIAVHVHQVSSGSGWFAIDSMGPMTLATIMFYLLVSLEQENARTGTSELAISIECVTEDLCIKKEVIRKIEQAVSADSFIGMNASAILTMLQQGTAHPEKIFGTYRTEPAHITRFMGPSLGRILSQFTPNALSRSRSS